METVCCIGLPVINNLPVILKCSNKPHDRYHNCKFPKRLKVENLLSVFCSDNTEYENNQVKEGYCLVPLYWLLLQLVIMCMIVVR